MARTKGALTVRAFAYVVALAALIAGACMIAHGGALELWLFYWKAFLDVPYAFLGGVTLVPAFMILAALVLGGGHADVELDAGGVRWARGRTRGYVEYGSLRSASLEGGKFGSSVLVLHGTGGDALRLLLPSHEHPRDLLGALLNRIAGRPASTFGEEALFLERSRRDLSSWLAAIRAHVSSAGKGYRQASIDFEALERLATDANTPVERRAAAVHALLASSAQGRSARIVDDDAPPLVIVAAELAAEGTIPLEMLLTALDHVPRDDREAALTVLARRVRVAEAHVRVAEAPDEPSELEDVVDETAYAAVAARIPRRPFQ